MISFVWPPGEPMYAGTGGSETYTAGHVRELLRRGIEAQVVTIGHGIHDGREDFYDIPFIDLEDQASIAVLKGIVVFVNRAYSVTTKNKSAIIFHCAIPKQADLKKHLDYIVGKTIIATSVYSGQQWALYLGIPYSDINIVLPFADPIYGSTERLTTQKKTRVLYAGRLHPQKGIYTLIEMMHEQTIREDSFRTSIVEAGLHVEVGREIARMLQGYPYATLIPAQKTVKGMADLLTSSDILLMPSVYNEPFGMLSVEAQYTGCRVVASNVGGLPETNCGLLTLVAPRDPLALLTGIKQCIALGPATKRERKEAVSKFTLAGSVDSLLTVLDY